MNSRPDIVFILSDQWNARYMGCAGHPQVQTPHLDALAARGCIFDAAYTPSPVCMPARASLVSGLYPHAHGFFCNYTGMLFPPEQVTLFRCLPDGYVCRQTLAYLDRAPIDKPLFLFASFPGPHPPLDAPGKYADMYNPADVVLPENYNEKRCKYGRQATAEMTAQYMGKITHLDDRVGEIVAALKHRGNWENTVVVFTSDHGERMGEHGLVSKTGFEEGSARVPLIIGGPAAPIGTPGHLNASPVSFLDLFPTFLDLSGAEIPDYCQAVSLLPIVSDKTDRVQDAVFSEISRNDQFCYMVRDSRWKWSIQAQNERLFDMQNDPHEMQNLAQSPAHADTAQRLRNRLLTFLTDTQLNHARGYKPLFTRIGMQFPTEDPADRKRIIRDRLRQVHIERDRDPAHQA